MNTPHLNHLADVKAPQLFLTAYSFRWFHLKMQKLGLSRKTFTKTHSTAECIVLHEAPQQTLAMRRKLREGFRILLVIAVWSRKGTSEEVPSEARGKMSVRQEIERRAAREMRRRNSTRPPHRKSSILVGQRSVELIEESGDKEPTYEFSFVVLKCYRIDHRMKKLRFRDLLSSRCEYGYDKQASSGSSR